MKSLRSTLFSLMFTVISLSAFSQGGGIGLVVGGMYNATDIEETDSNFISEKNGFGYKAGISLSIPFGERIAVNVQPAYSVRYHGDEDDSLGLVTHQVLELPVVFRHSFVEFSKGIFLGYIVGVSTDLNLSSERSIKDVSQDVTKHYKSLYFSLKAGLPFSIRKEWGTVVIQPFGQFGMGTLLDKDFEETVNGAINTPFKDINFGQQFYGLELIYFL